MGEQQIRLELEISSSAASAGPSDIRDEIARAWGLPLGQQVEVCFRGSQRAAITGTLELLSTPNYPWDPHQPLQLRIAGFTFDSREIERWTKI